MESTERDGARLLAALRDDAPPESSTVDISRAVRTGTRRVRVRQALVAVAAAVVTGLAVAVVPAIVSRPSVVEPVRPAAELSVLNQQFTVGSAGGFTPVSYETGRSRHRVELGSAYEGGSTDRATVTMYARGHGSIPDGERAEDVNGRKAFWVPTTRGAEIAWEWSDGAWAFAHVDATGPDARDRAHRVAESVGLGAGTPVTVPFTIPTPAAPLRLLGVITPFGTSSDRTSGALLVLGTTEDADRILVGVQRDLTHDLVTGEPRQDTPVTIPDVGGGFSALAQADHPGTPLTDLAASVRLVPDLNSWTPNPLR